MAYEDLVLYRHSVGNVYHSKHNLRASILQAVYGNWSWLALRMILTAFNPEILSILGNMLIISKLTNLQSEVKVLLLFKLSIIVSISDLSFTLLSIFKTLEYKHFSTKIDKFSITLPKPLVITLTGLPTLCVLIKPYILPGKSQ